MSAGQGASDQLQIAYSIIVGIKANVGSNFYVGKNLVDHYHQALDMLESAGFSTGIFRIPAAEVQRRVVGGNYLDGSVEYGEKPEVERTVFLARLDSALQYFSLKSSGTEIGFGRD